MLAGPVGALILSPRRDASRAPPTDAFTPNGPMRVQVIWTLSADEGKCEYANSVVAHRRRA